MSLLWKKTVKCSSCHLHAVPCCLGSLLSNINCISAKTLIQCCRFSPYNLPSNMQNFHIIMIIQRNDDDDNTERQTWRMTNTPLPVFKVSCFTRTLSALGNRALLWKMYETQISRLISTFILWGESSGSASQQICGSHQRGCCTIRHSFSRSGSSSSQRQGFRMLLVWLIKEVELQGLHRGGDDLGDWIFGAVSRS